MPRTRSKKVGNDQSGSEVHPSKDAFCALERRHAVTNNSTATVMAPDYTKNSAKSGEGAL
jgi:hypothetical protein